MLLAVKSVSIRRPSLIKPRRVSRTTQNILLLLAVVGHICALIWGPFKVRKWMKASSSESNDKSGLLHVKPWDFASTVEILATGHWDRFRIPRSRSQAPTSQVQVLHVQFTRELKMHDTQTTRRRCLTRPHGGFGLPIKATPRMERRELRCSIRSPPLD